MEPAIHAAIRDLHLPLGSRGLDAGCGIGLPALLLAAEVGPSGQVTALDKSYDFIREGKEIVARAGFSDQIGFHKGDLHHLPYEKDTFDWAWSSSCVGYDASIDPYVAVQELSRVVQPGGAVALMAWSSEKLLPGFPLLEAHLSATTSGLAPFDHKSKPELHFMRALGWFRSAGLKSFSAQTFVGDVQAPLSKEQHQALQALLAMRWKEVESELSEEMRRVYQQICFSHSSEYIADHPDYYAFFTLSLFTGYV